MLRAPSRWRLHEKMGRPLAVVHQPVPLYADQLSAPVDRFMRHLKTGKLAERLNWSVTDDPALSQIEGKHRTRPDPTITAANAALRLFLQVERQTLSRLPDSGFVLFTIRVHSYPLTRVLAQPGAAARLAAALRALPASMAAYKSLPPLGMRCSAISRRSPKREHVCSRIEKPRSKPHELHRPPQRLARKRQAHHRCHPCRRKRRAAVGRPRHAQPGGGVV